jgi:hypothetical protein
MSNISNVKSMMRWARHIAHMVMRNANKTFVIKSEGNKPVGKPRHRWENNITMVLLKMWWEL